MATVKCNKDSAGKEMFEIMLQNFMVDQDDDTLVVTSKPNYDADMDSWVVTAKDDNRVYILYDCGDGNIDVRYGGTK